MECMPADIPDSISYDITEMEIGDTVRVKDLAIDEQLTCLDKETMVVLVLSQPKMVVEEEPEEELAEGEEPAEGEEGEKKEAAPAEEGEEKREKRDKKEKKEKK